MSNLSKDDFFKVWNDSSKESILNQFYYEHIELRNVLSVVDEVREYIKIMSDSRNVDQTYDIWYSCKEYLLEILSKVNKENK